MPDAEIRPFSDEHLDAAAELLAARHKRHRAVEALLPARFEDPAAAREEVEALWRRAAAGSACFRGGRLTGYLLGIARDPDRWGGENVWVDYAGHAFEEPEDVRDAYAAAAAEWFEQGRMRHFAQIPASEPALVDSWFRLGFGQQQADGIREVPVASEARAPEGLEIRAPTVDDDVEALLELDLALPRHHRTSPVFTLRPLPTEDELRAEWAKTLAGSEETVLVGFHEGRAVACWALVDANHEPEFRGLHAPDDACYLKFAATIPEARGSGIGVALTEASLAWAAGQGHRAIGTDWRVTNLLASRFWPRRGFRTTFLRLYRHLP
jgi:ribosomal protein S18 acetylase RimI-like enzyme